MRVEISKGINGLAVDASRAIAMLPNDSQETALLPSAYASLKKPPRNLPIYHCTNTFVHPRCKSERPTTFSLYASFHLLLRRLRALAVAAVIAVSETQIAHSRCQE
jgi:hypothetical protein